MVQNLEARVLICDPYHVIVQGLVRNLHKRFGISEPPNPESILIMSKFNSFEHSGVEYTFVDDIKVVPKLVKGSTPPYYSLIVYETEQAKKDGGAGIIADVRKVDFFLPQMVVGRGVTAILAGHCARAGALYFAESSSELAEQVSKIFQRPSRLPKLKVIKIGGSAFDFDRQNKGSYNLQTICQTLSKLHREYDKSGYEKIANRIIVTAGAGQFGDIIKDQRSKYLFNPGVVAQYPMAMAEALEANLKSIKPYFGSKASLLTTGAFYYISTSSTSKRIPLIGTAPHYIMVRNKIPLQDSDTHTVALAEFYGAERIILIKRTDGVYNFDPYRGFVPNPADGTCADITRWAMAQEYNKRYSVVSVDELLSGNISRDGTGIDGNADDSTGHLMEESALIYMRDKCEYVKEILIVHIAPEEMFCQERKNAKNPYIHLYANEKLHIVTEEDGVAGDYKTSWQSRLEKSIENALKGIARSKIVKER